MGEECAICSGRADEIFRRTEVWSNERWRVTTSTYRDVKNFCYLEPRRHIRYISELDGLEAEEFGVVLSSVSAAVKKSSGAKLVYVYIYGDHIPHLHVHLAPHKEGDNYQDEVVKAPDLMSEEMLEETEMANVVSELNKEILARLPE